MLLKYAQIRIILFMITLSLSAIQLMSCLDAAKRNVKNEKESAKQLTGRRVRTSYLKQRKCNFLSDYDKNFQVSGTALKPWKSALLVLSEDEKRTLNSLKSDLIMDKPYRAITSGRELLKAGKEGLRRIISSASEAKNEDAKLVILRTLRKGIRSVSLSEEETKEIAEISKKWVNDDSQIVSTEALKLWINIIKENELVELAQYLDFPNDSVRSMIYLKLVQAKSNNVLDALLNHLNSEIVEVRIYAVNLLRFLSGKHFGYDPLGEPISRQLAICRWVSYVMEVNLIKTTNNRYK